MVAVLGIYFVYCLHIFADAATPPKSVNLALETSFRFQPEDVSQNATVLQNVRRFLDKLEGIIKPKSIHKLRSINSQHDPTSYRKDLKSGKRKGILKLRNLAELKDLPSHINGGVITTFLSELGAAVIHYEDEDVKLLATALRDEVTKTYQSNQVFREMLTNIKIQAFLLNSVTEWARTNPLSLKVEIAKYVTNTENTDEVAFFRNINQFFNNDHDAFRKLLRKYIKAKKTKKFGSALNKTFLLIIQRYTELKDEDQTKFRNAVVNLSKFVVENYKHRLVTPNLDLGRRSDPKNMSESVREDFEKWENSIEDEVDKDIKIANDIQVFVYRQP